MTSVKTRNMVNQLPNMCKMAAKRISENQLEDN